MTKVKRIAYVFIILKHQAGILNKLERYAEVCDRNKIPVDFIWLTKKGVPEEAVDLKYIKGEYSDTENIVGIRLWQARKINELHKDYCKVILRYPLYDPFLGILLRNRKSIITEHHTKEIEEYKLQGSKRYYLEKWFGNKWLKGFGGIIGVTDELRQYEILRSKTKAKSIFIPNSIPVENTNFHDNELKVFEHSPLRLTMVANFRPWHGIHSIVKGVKEYNQLSDKYILNLVGEMPQELIETLKKFPQVKLHGFKNSKDLKSIYNQTDIGLSGYSLEVKQMKEATTLKVREYYANGIPVVFGHLDKAFPDDFKYKYYNTEFNIPEILDFAEKIKGVRKSEVFEAAKPYISSELMLKKMYDFAITV